MHLRKTNKALRAADDNVVTYKIETNSADKIFAFLRKNGDDEVLVILNLSAEKVICEILNNVLKGKFINIFQEEIVDFTKLRTIELKPWNYLLYEKEKPAKF